MERSILIVEGKDDCHCLRHLLNQHDVCDTIQIKDVDGCEDVLNHIAPTVKSTTGGRVGFVLDAGADVAARWQAVRDRFARVSVSAPAKIPASGFVADASEFKVRVGAWLMPDCLGPGAIEDFLLRLVPSSDTILPHARTSTDEAILLGANLRSIDRQKGILHAWLAWQAEPGRPYGIAVQAKFFDVNQEPAGKFIQWIRSVFPTV